MAEVRVTKVEKGQTKIRSVPIAVTPEGFWCCPSPVAFQKALKAHNSLHKPKSASPPPPPPTKATAHRRQTILSDEQQTFGPSRSVSDGQRDIGPEAPDTPALVASMAAERIPKSKVENLPRRVAIEFGEPGTSDIKVILLGKQGFCVKLTVHKNVLVENSNFFADKLADQQSNSSCLEIEECEDVEIYVEAVGLMYCKEMRQRLMKQSVSRVLRILKIAEVLGFSSCMQSCLEYLEAVPWVGDDEEEKVVSSVLRLQYEGIGVSTVLKRVTSDMCKSPKDTLSHIIGLVLGSNEERGRREMKSVVLKLLRENNNVSSSSGPSDVCNQTLNESCRNCSRLLLSLFKQAAEPESPEKPVDNKDRLAKQIALASDNLSWLLDILADRQAADEFALMWAAEQELSALHIKLPIASRYHVSNITTRLFVGIGNGELLPSKDTRQLLLQTWLQPLISDYNWLQHGRSFERKVVEEGIGRTILTLPLEDQQSIMLSWLGNFLKSGDSCPNLQKAFEVWWRRTFVRPYVDGQQGNSLHSNS